MPQKALIQFIYWSYDLISCYWIDSNLTSASDRVINQIRIRLALFPSYSGRLIASETAYRSMTYISFVSTSQNWSLTWAFWDKYSENMLPNRLCFFFHQCWYRSASLLYCGVPFTGDHRPQSHFRQTLFGRDAVHATRYHQMFSLVIFLNQTGLGPLKRLTLWKEQYCGDKCKLVLNDFYAE